MYTYGITGTSVDEFRDVTLTAVSNGQVLKWDSATSQWVNVDPSTLSIALDNLSDVTLTSPAEFQVLEYNGTSWINKYASVATEVRNVDTVTLATGTAVYLFGANGDIATVKRADNDSDTTSSKVVGLVGAPILQNESGPVITRGYVDGINLSVGYAPGDILWLGEDGGFTKVKPVAPEHTVFLGVVCRANANGIVYVAAQNGYELDELHDVKINGALADNDVLQYDSATSLWKNTALADVGMSFDNLSDVAVANPANSEFLAYNANSSNWRRTTLDAGTAINTSYTNTPANYQGVYNNGASYAIGDTVSTDGNPYGTDGGFYIRTSNPGNPGYPPAVGGGNNAEWDEVNFVPSLTVNLDAELDDLTDVAVATPARGHALEYDGTSWNNAPLRVYHKGLQTPVNSRKYVPLAASLPQVPGINVGSCALIVFKDNCSITELSIALAANYAGATTYAYRLGIYADSNGAPGALIVDAGTVSIATGATAGPKTITLGSPVAVTAGTPVWLVASATYTGTVPTLIHYAGNYQPYSDYGLSSASHTQAACLAYLGASGTALPATFALASPETQPVGVAVYATVTVP